ncbi:hypothetical protein [Flavobacterium cerinum]|uniref:DKNYY domain-containing protein n=1 Tax=Flavobacterium cerinum TaxID=2502784 RepID=A0ABY5ISI0_9FLAO|nr:hypothetical protein [Flavobacterium cerinum]UUC45744.1 hypothetical protein NOX80_00695 [Flavobacterium cerinum]
MHDSIVGKQSLAINNGYFHSNPYPIINGKYRYYTSSDKYLKGTVVYENQTYYDFDVKYDLFQDILVYQPSAESGNIGIELAQQNVDNFIINNKKFVNLSKTVSPMITFIKGYYEENLVGKNFIFYVKHHKDKREITNGTRTYYEFNDNNEYYIFQNGNYHKIASKSDVVALFPDHKKKINDLYSMNKSTEKENKYLFYEDLIHKINSLLETNHP